ncbi:type VII secretion target [Corynebacterium mendelii]
MDPPAVRAVAAKLDRAAAAVRHAPTMGSALTAAWSPLPQLQAVGACYQQAFDTAPGSLRATMTTIADQLDWMAAALTTTIDMFETHDHAFARALDQLEKGSVTAPSTATIAPRPAELFPPLVQLPPVAGPPIGVTELITALKSTQQAAAEAAADQWRTVGVSVGEVSATLTEAATGLRAGASGGVYDKVAANIRRIAATTSTVSANALRVAATAQRLALLPPPLIAALMAVKTSIEAFYAPVPMAIPPALHAAGAAFGTSVITPLAIAHIPPVVAFTSTSRPHLSLPGMLTSFLSSIGAAGKTTVGPIAALVGDTCERIGVPHDRGTTEKQVEDAITEYQKEHNNITRGVDDRLGARRVESLATAAQSSGFISPSMLTGGVAGPPSAPTGIPGGELARTVGRLVSQAAPVTRMLPGLVGGLINSQTMPKAVSLPTYGDALKSSQAVGGRLGGSHYNPAAGGDTAGATARDGGAMVPPGGPGAGRDSRNRTHSGGEVGADIDQPDRGSSHLKSLSSAGMMFPPGGTGALRNGAKIFDPSTVGTVQAGMGPLPGPGSASLPASGSLGGFGPGAGTAVGGPPTAPPTGTGSGGSIGAAAPAGASGGQAATAAARPPMMAGMGPAGAAGKGGKNQRMTITDPEREPNRQAVVGDAGADAAPQIIGDWSRQ